MKIQEITNKEVWEEFCRDCSEKTFLHSWNWGKFQEEMGERIWRLGVFEEGSLLGLALLVKVRAKRGSFLLIPHGPVVKSSLAFAQVLEIVFKEAKKIAKAEGVSFLRVNPVLERSKDNMAVFKKLGFKGAPIQMHPEASWKLDIQPTEEELLKEMRKTTRYLVKKTQGNADITVELSEDIKDVETFSKLHEQVSQRQHFIPFSLEYLQNEFEVFSKDRQILLFLGKYKGELAAVSFVVFWSGIGFYHHAVSQPQYAKLSMPYLLLWEAIKESKKRECELFDFWGYVNPKEHPEHPWAGPTLFKMGFGGRPYLYVKAQDFPLHFIYWITYAFEKLRRLKRGL